MASSDPIQVTIEAIKTVKAIPEFYTSKASIDEQRSAHEKAKAYLGQYLPLVKGQVEFISPPEGMTEHHYKDVDTSIPLQENIFGWEPTDGVGIDIQADGNREEDNIVMYGAASQFNGCEAPSRYTVMPGYAVATYSGDGTQGPQAQIQFHPLQVELINCAGNIGFNGLVYVLDKDTKGSVSHGYFTPSKSHSGAILSQLGSKAGHKSEYLCVSNYPFDIDTNTAGKKLVHLTMVAAPAFGGYAFRDSVDGEDRYQVQFLCALNGYRAQLNHCINLAKRERKPVVFKPTASGLGVFGNDVEIVAKAFYQACKEFEDLFAQYNGKVFFQVYQSRGPARELADFLSLKKITTF